MFVGLVGVGLVGVGGQFDPLKVLSPVSSKQFTLYGRIRLVLRRQPGV